MDVRLTLICFFLLTLQGGNACLIDAKDTTCTGTEGGDIKVECSFTLSGWKRIFCKDGCEDGHILIVTEEKRAQRDRYSIYYDERSILDSALYVSITNLTKSDSGRYQCGLVRSILQVPSYWDFEIRVLDAPTSPKPKPNRTPRPPSVPSASTQTTAQSSASTSASPESNMSQQPQTATAGSPGVLLYVGLTLVVMFIIFLVALLVFCRKRAGNPKAPPVQTEYADVTEANRVYEEIREDPGSRPVQISTVYASAKYSKPNGVETSDVYSFATAPASPSNPEDGKVTYSVVNFPSDAAASLHSAPCGGADNVVYSVPRGAASSDGSHAKDASPPLYSTITPPQM